MQPITVGASAVNRQAGGAPSTAPSPMNGSIPSAGASTFTTNSAPPPNGTGTGGSQGQGPNPPRPGAFAGPRMSGIFAPPLGLGGLHLGGQHAGAPLPGFFVDPFGLIPVVDPYLPCNSRHFIPRRVLQPNAANAPPQVRNAKRYFKIVSMEMRPMRLVLIITGINLCGNQFWKWWCKEW